VRGLGRIHVKELTCEAGQPVLAGLEMFDDRVSS
jgi:hypothetical protein